MGSKVLITSFRDGVRNIMFNRPQRKNAITGEIYQTVTNILNEDAKNDQVVVTIVTGVGDFYSSGNDIKSAFEEKMNPDISPTSGVDKATNFIQAFINYPKILIAVVNGPAIGIAATTIALCDIVYASEKAYFDTPFLKLGLCPEGASSYLFPRILGRSKASEMLLLNEKLTAQEAYHYGLVSKVIPHEDVDNFIESLYKYGKLPVNSVKINKQLIMRNLNSTLTDCNKSEKEGLEKCIESEEFGEAIMNYMSTKSKL